MTEVHLFIIFAFVFLISILGLFGNAMVIWAVKKHKDLRTKHGTLLSFLCLYQSMVLLLELGSTGRNLIQAKTYRSPCFYFLLPLTITFNVQLTLLLVISLDLVFLVLRPTKYNTIEVFPYVCAVQTPCFAAALVFVIMGIILLDNEPIQVCNMPASYPFTLESSWNAWVIAICITIMTVYAATTFVMWFRDWQNVRKSEGSCILDPSLRYQRKMIRTLSVFMLVFFCSGFASAITILSAKLVPFLRGDEANLAKSYATVPALISCSQNFYVYNAMSKDFHKAFKKNLITLRTWKDTKFSQTNSLFQVVVSGRRSSSKVVTINMNSCYVPL